MCGWCKPEKGGTGPRLALREVDVSLRDSLGFKCGGDGLTWVFFEILAGTRGRAAGQQPGSVVASAARESARSVPDIRACRHKHSTVKQHDRGARQDRVLFDLQRRRWSPLHRSFDLQIVALLHTCCCPTTRSQGLSIPTWRFFWAR